LSISIHLHIKKHAIWDEKTNLPLPPLSWSYKGYATNYQFSFYTPLLLNAPVIIRKILKYIYSSMSSLFSNAKEKEERQTHSKKKNIFVSKIIF